LSSPAKGQAAGSASVRLSDLPQTGITAEPRTNAAGRSNSSNGNAVFIYKNPLGADASKNITQSFGTPWVGDTTKRHTGIDIASIQGAPVISASGGTVVRTGWLGCVGDHSGQQPLNNCPDRNQNWGDYVVVQKADGSAVAYLHVDPSPGLKKGSKVESGTLIGSVYEDHLHLNECHKPYATSWAVDGCQKGAVSPTILEQGNYARPILQN
jgi:murein DD-endopeptidase MepM/ murein hydrolase activator NlpD